MPPDKRLLIALTGWLRLVTFLPAPSAGDATHL